MQKLDILHERYESPFSKRYASDEDKIRQIDPMIARKFGFDKCFPVSGQTYSRKLDMKVDINV